MPVFAKLFKKAWLDTFLQEGLELARDAAPQAAAGAFLFLLHADTQPCEPDICGDAPAGFAPPLLLTADALPADMLSREVALEGAGTTLLVLGPLGPDNQAAAHRLLCFCAKRLEDHAGQQLVRRSLGAETLELYRELSVLQRAVVNLNSSMKYGEVIQALATECQAAALPADYCMVFGKDNELELVERLSSDEAPPFPGAPPAAGQLARLARSRLFSHVLEHDKAELVNDLDKDPRWAGEVPGLARLILVPLSGSHISMGVLALAGLDASRSFSSGHLKKAVTLAGVASISMANSYHFEQVQYILMALIKAMATAIDARDRLTAGHSQRVAQYALGLAMQASKDHSLCPDISFSDEELQEIFYAGLLHDVGKIGVREEVLTKETRLPRPHLELIGLRLALWGEMGQRPWKETYARLEIINKAYDITDEDSELVSMLAGESLQVGGKEVTVLSDEEAQRLLTPRGNLTPLEWEEIKRHPAESHRILQNIPFTTHFPNILTMVLQHHERLDGSGYPNGATGREITSQSRIMAIVDVYDALRQDRHYKKALSQEMALTILRQESKRKKLDHRLVELFCRDIEDIEKGLHTGMDFLPGRDFLQ